MKVKQLNKILNLNDKNIFIHEVGGPLSISSLIMAERIREGKVHQSFDTDERIIKKMEIEKDGTVNIYVKVCPYSLIAVFNDNTENHENSFLDGADLYESYMVYKDLCDSEEPLLDFNNRIVKLVIICERGKMIHSYEKGNKSKSLALKKDNRKIMFLV